MMKKKDNEILEKAIKYIDCIKDFTDWQTYVYNRLVKDDVLKISKRNLFLDSQYDFFSYLSSLCSFYIVQGKSEEEIAIDLKLYNYIREILDNQYKRRKSMIHQTV